MKLLNPTGLLPNPKETAIPKIISNSKIQVVRKLTC